MQIQLQLVWTHNPPILLICMTRHVYEHRVGYPKGHGWGPLCIYETTNIYTRLQATHIWKMFALGPNMVSLVFQPPTINPKHNVSWWQWRKPLSATFAPCSLRSQVNYKRKLSVCFMSPSVWVWVCAWVCVLSV